MLTSVPVSIDASSFPLFVPVTTAVDGRDLQRDGKRAVTVFRGVLVPVLQPRVVHPSFSLVGS